MNRARVAAWLGFVMSVVLLGAAFRNVGIEDVGLGLKQVRLGPWLWAVALTVATYVLRAWRWQALMDPPIRFRHAFGASMVGLFVSNILPARLGELVRVEMIDRLEGSGRSATLGTLVLERTLDLGGVLAIYAGVAFSTALPPALTAFAGPAALGATACFAVPLLLGFRPGTQATLATVVVRCLPRRFSRAMEPRMLRLVQGAALRPVTGPAVFAQTAVIWLVTAAAVDACLRACGLSIPIAAAFFTLASLVLGSLLPTTPGLIGTHEFFAKESVGLFTDLPAAESAFAITSHLAWFIPVTCLGFYYMNRYHLDLATVRKLKDPHP